MQYNDEFSNNPSYHHWNINNYKLVLENCSFQYYLLNDVNITHSDVNTDALFILSKQHRILDCESVWTLTVDILNSICNRDCFADCSLVLTLIVSFWNIALLVCCWKQITMSQSWNWTHLQYSTMFKWMLVYCL